MSIQLQVWERKAELISPTLLQILGMMKSRWLLQSFQHRDQDFYCMTELQEPPYHVQQTISQKLHLHQGFHWQSPKIKKGFSMLQIRFQVSKDLVRMLNMLMVFDTCYQEIYWETTHLLKDWYLVSNIKKGNVVLFLNYISYFFPLFRCWINTSRVMSTSM